MRSLLKSLISKRIFQVPRSVKQGKLFSINFGQLDSIGFGHFAILHVFRDRGDIEVALIRDKARHSDEHDLLDNLLPN